MAKAWIYQRKEQIREIGIVRAPWYVRWYDHMGKQRSKSCGSGEDGRKEANKLRLALNANPFLQMLDDPLDTTDLVSGLTAEQVMAVGDRQVVYFVEAVGLERVKIGRTGNLANRLRSLQRWSPVQLRVLLIVSGGPDLEAHLHRMLARFRLHGEWFQISSAVRTAIRHLADQADNCNAPACQSNVITRNEAP